MKFVRYLFPYVRRRDKLPLLPRHYSSEHGRTPIPADLEAIRLIKGYGLARTDRDAARVLKRYPGMPMARIFKEEKRKRRRNPLKRAWKRFLDLWR